MKNHQSRFLARGFTLIEMLVTITIIVILAGLSLGGFKYVSVKQANSQAEIQIKLLGSAIEEYKLDNGEYPVSTNTNDLYRALYYDGAQDPPLNDGKIYLADLDPENNKQGWTEGTGAGVRIIDPWGNEYVYRSPGTINPDFDLMSRGQDGKTNASDPNGPDSKDDKTNY